MDLHDYGKEVYKRSVQLTVYEMKQLLAWVKSYK